MFWLEAKLVVCCGQKWGNACQDVVFKQLGDDICKGNRRIVPSITYVHILVFANGYCDDASGCLRLHWLVRLLITCCVELLCLVVCIARRCQIVYSFVPGGCCVALQMLIRAGVLSWINPGVRFRSSLGSVMTGTMTVCIYSWGILPCIKHTLNRLLRWLHSSVLYLLTPRLNAGWLLCFPDCDEIMTTWFCPVGIPLRHRHRIIQYK